MKRGLKRYKWIWEITILEKESSTSKEGTEAITKVCSRNNLIYHVCKKRKEEEEEMALLSLLTIILTAVIFVIALLTFSKNGTKKNPRKLPPGSKGLPLIGETISFLKTHSQNSVGEYMQHRLSRFGNVFSTHLFGSLSVISANPKLNRLVMNNDVLFGNGMPHAFRKVIGDNSMSLMVGDVHKHMRMTVLDFLHPERMRTIFFQDADTLASELISSWKDGDVISVKNESTKFSLCIMAKRLLSMKVDDDIEKLATQYDSVTRAFTSSPLYFPGTTYWKGLHARENLIKMFKQEIVARRGNECNGRNDDFLGWLMKNTDYSEDKICDFLLGILFAGHDTSARAICLLIYYLENCPKAVCRMREEHIEVLGSKQKGGESKITWDDYKGMEFTKCVINETLRLGNIARFTMRTASENVEFEDYLIPQGCRVLIHFGAVHLDPSLYEDPTRFNPWRWLSSSGVKNFDSFMPFSKGARMCPGADLARMEMIVFLHHLIMKYDWELAEPDHPIVTPLIEFPKDLPIKIHAIYKNTNV